MRTDSDSDDSSVHTSDSRHLYGGGYARLEKRTHQRCGLCSPRCNRSGGIGVLGGPTGGYIIGFLFTALIVGLMTDFLGRKLWVLAVSMVAGLAVCYLFGTIWFMIAMHTDFVAALLTCVVPFLLADAAKIVVATVLVNRLDKIVKL
mgnify:CR=1 FL=1